MKNRIKSGLVNISNPIFAPFKIRSRCLDNNVYIVEIDPDDIKFKKIFPSTCLPIEGERAVSGELDGPWDFMKVRFEKQKIYNIIEKRINGKEWGETGIYDSGGYIDTTTSDSIAKRCDMIDELIDSIRVNGYVHQVDLRSTIKTDFPMYKQEINGTSLPDEVFIGMTRNSKFMQLEYGRHRLSIAKVLDIDSIPAVLSLYHPKSSSDISDYVNIIEEIEI